MALHRRWHRLFRGLLFASLAVVPGAPSEAATETATPSVWSWKAAERVDRLALDFVRGSVVMVRRPGAVEVRVTRHALEGDPLAAEIVVDAMPGGYVIRDRFPAPVSGFFSECLPPPDGKGDIWHYSVRLDATVYAPVGLEVETTVMDRGEPQ